VGSNPTLSASSLPIADCRVDSGSRERLKIGNWKSKIGNHMSDDKLALDEARRAAQHDSVKSQVEGEVQAEIGQRAETKATAGEAHRIDQVAGEFRSKAVNEVIDTEREVGRSRSLARVSQIVDYIFWVIYALLGMRFLLALLAARSSAGFVQFIVAISNPFYAPFRGIVASPQTDGGHTLLLPIVVAIISYALLHLGINALLRMLAHRKTEI
jgi:uncharacterized protein YggT (Ycf19 family)